MAQKKTSVQTLKWKSNVGRIFSPLDLPEPSVPHDNTVERDIINRLTNLLPSISPEDLQKHHNLFRNAHNALVLVRFNMDHFQSREFRNARGEEGSCTSFCLAAVLTISKLSGSGWTPYFFMMLGSDNSVKGIRAAKNVETLESVTPITYKLKMYPTPQASSPNNRHAHSFLGFKTEYLSN